MTLFKVDPNGNDEYTITMLYYCAPMTSSENDIRLEIQPKGCEKTEMQWKVVCGNSLSRQM